MSRAQETGQRDLAAILRSGKVLDDATDHRGFLVVAWRNATVAFVDLAFGRLEKERLLMDVDARFERSKKYLDAIRPALSDLAGRVSAGHLSVRGDLSTNPWEVHSALVAGLESRLQASLDSARQLRARIDSDRDLPVSEIAPRVQGWRDDLDGSMYGAGVLAELVATEPSGGFGDWEFEGEPNVNRESAARLAYGIMNLESMLQPFEAYARAAQPLMETPMETSPGERRQR